MVVTSFTWDPKISNACLNLMSNTGFCGPYFLCFPFVSCQSLALLYLCYSKRKILVCYEIFRYMWLKKNTERLVWYSCFSLRLHLLKFGDLDAVFSLLKHTVQQDTSFTPVWYVLKWLWHMLYLVYCLSIYQVLKLYCDEKMGV